MGGHLARSRRAEVLSSGKGLRGAFRLATWVSQGRGHER